MSWKNRIAMLVLPVLTALPMSGTVCAMLCASAAKNTASHHGSGTNCGETSGSSADVQVRGVAQHDCSTQEAAARQATTTAAERADVSAASAPLAVATLHTTAKAPPDSTSAFDHNAPPGTTLPGTTSLVLRV